MLGLKRSKPSTAFSMTLIPTQQQAKLRTVHVTSISQLHAFAREQCNSRDSQEGEIKSCYEYSTYKKWVRASFVRRAVDVPPAAACVCVSQPRHICSFFVQYGHLSASGRFFVLHNIVTSTSPSPLLHAKHAFLRADTISFFSPACIRHQIFQPRLASILGGGSMPEKIPVTYS